MEEQAIKEQSLETLIESIQKQEVKRTEPYRPEIWYNCFGDCIEFQTEDVAITADRIDPLLTIYRSAENNKAVGFQLKDIKALMKKHRCDQNIVQATALNDELMSVMSILIKAYEEKPITILKKQGYSEALRVATSVLSQS